MEVTKRHRTGERKKQKAVEQKEWCVMHIKAKMQL